MDELLTKWEEMGYTFRPLSDLAENKSENSSENSSLEGNGGRILQDEN